MYGQPDQAFLCHHDVLTQCEHSDVAAQSAALRVLSGLKHNTHVSWFTLEWAVTKITKNLNDNERMTWAYINQ